MTDKQFNFIMQSLRDRIMQRLANREIRLEYNPDCPYPDDRFAMFIMVEDVNCAILNSFNEILNDEYMI